MALGRRKAKAIHLLESSEDAKNRSQLSHLFPPIKMHQLGSYSALDPPHRRPAITKEQGKAAYEHRFLCHPVSHAKQLPNRGTSEVVVFFPIGKKRPQGRPTVTIPFRKAGGEVSGINLYRQRKGEKSPQKVGFFMRTPAIDTTPGKSGQLTYTARAVIDGQEIGNPSDPVSVTVG